MIFEFIINKKVILSYKYFLKLVSKIYLKNNNILYYL